MAVTDTFRFDPIVEAHEEELAGVSTDELIVALEPLPWDETIVPPAEVAPEVEEQIVRHLLLRYAMNEKKGSRLKALLDELARPYKTKLDKLAVEQAGIRDVIQSWLLRRGVNSLPFPGLYTPTLSTRCKGGKAKVSDQETFRRHLLDLELDGIVDDATKTVEVFDAQAALDALLTDTSLTVLPSGEIVNTSTGETIAVPGVEVEPESKTLQLRGAN